MKSTYKLVWSNEALKNLQGIIHYLEEKWTKKEIQRFVHLLDHRLELFQQNPVYSQKLKVIISY